MQFDTLFLVYGAIFLATILLIEGVFSLAGDLKHGSRRSINRRLQLLEQGGTTNGVLKTLRRDFRSGLLAGTELDRSIAQAGWTISAGRFIVLLIAATMAIGAGLSVSGAISPVIGVVLGVILGAVAPLLYLRIAKTRRLRRFRRAIARRARCDRPQLARAPGGLGHGSGRQGNAGSDWQRIRHHRR